MNLQKLNQELSAALGVQDTSLARRVSLTIEAGETPKVEVERHGHKTLDPAALLAVLNAHGIDPKQLRADGSDAPLELRELPALERLQLQPGDILVLSVAGRCSDETAKRIRETMERSIPGHKCIVIADGMKLASLGRAAEAAAAEQLPCRLLAGPIPGGNEIPRNADARVFGAAATALTLPAPNFPEPTASAERRAWAELMLPAGMKDPGDEGLSPVERASWRAWAHRAALEFMGRGG